MPELPEVELNEPPWFFNMDSDSTNRFAQVFAERMTNIFTSRK